MSDHSAESVAVRRRAIYALIDLTFLIVCGITSVSWLADGHKRDAMILAAIAYWGTPWLGSLEGRQAACTPSEDGAL